jgi:hypothetical protein
MGSRSHRPAKLSARKQLFFRTADYQAGLIAEAARPCRTFAHDIAERSVMISAFCPMPHFDNADREKLAALIGEARELRAETETLRQKSQAQNNKSPRCAVSARKAA